jgi:hypothetical protein
MRKRVEWLFAKFSIAKNFLFATIWFLARWFFLGWLTSKWFELRARFYGLENRQSFKTSPGAGQFF